MRAPLTALSTLGIITVLGPSARASSLEERLAEQGERLVSDQLLDGAGNRQWVLHVDRTVDLDAVEAAGATIDWAWPDQGVVVVWGRGPDLDEALLAVRDVREVLPTTRPAVQSLEPDVSASEWDFVWPTGPDLYKENAQWPLYAIDAVDPVPSEDTESGWTPGEWKLPYDGDGITVASVDEGGPTLWCDPVDVRVDLSLPGWGVCALFGATEEDGECVAPDADLGDPATLCLALGDLVGTPADLDGDRCAFWDLPLADFYAAIMGYDYLNYDTIAQWFRPRHLHPDFDWYLPTAEATPELGEPGGVVPIFGALEDYRAYVEDRYLAHRLPTGVELVAEELAFAGVELALTDAFAAALDAGEVGACSTADARLPDPDALTWEPYSYALFDRPFDRAGDYRREGWNGYDATGELRVVVDPYVAPVDLFGVPWTGHGTFTAGPYVGRYREGREDDYGALRGMAPGAKFFSYPSFWSGFDVAAAWRRAPDDGVLVMNNSWIAPVFHGHRAYGTFSGEELLELEGVCMEQAGDALGKEALLVFAASNYGVDWDTARAEGEFLAIFQATANALVVGGTAPRGYHWTDDVSLWMPDAPGQPYDEGRRDHNLDRPFLYYYEPWPEISAGTSYGQVIDLMAPAGSWFVVGECVEDPDCGLAAWDDAIWFPYIEDLTDDYGIGPHQNGVGTSFASPYVAGVAALAAEAWRERHGRLPKPSQLKTVLTSSADAGVGPSEDLVVLSDVLVYPDTPTFWTSWEQIEKPGPDAWMGAGRLNAFAAIERAGR